MEKQIPKTKEEARQYAIEWQQWARERDLSYGELAEWGTEFERIGREFDLT